MTMTMPSTNKKVKYKQFTIKEQKAIMAASEGSDDETVINTIIQVLTNCVEGYDFAKAPLFDLEYAFAKLRSASAGETTVMRHTCQNKVDDVDCGTTNEVLININDIKIDIPHKDKFMVKINDTMSLKLKYVVAEDAVTLMNESIGTSELYEMIAKSIDIIATDEDAIKVEYNDELIAWCDDLPENTVKSIIQFIKDTPRATMKVEYVCTACNHEHSMDIQGINNFLE